MQQAGQPPVNFGAFKTSFSDKMNFIKRRFSSSDLGGDAEMEGQAPQGQGQMPPGHPTQGQGPGTAQASSTNPFAAQPPRPESAMGGPPPAANFGPVKNSTISAPTSPTRSVPPPGSSHFAAQNGAPHDSSLYSQVSGLTRNLFQAATGQKQGSGPTVREKAKCLLVIDDQHTDWSKYFRNKKILGDWEIRVEQAEFSEISLSSYTDQQLGCMVSLLVNRSGSKVARQFRPDFVLIRKNVHDAGHDWRAIVIGLLYGGVPCINSLHAIYNFLDKPWVFAHLAMIQRKLGRERFPLIDQAYYPNFKEMLNQQGKFPVVMKIGHAHGGVGKAKASSVNEFIDISSIAGMTSSYCTLEPFVDGKYDVHIQKIGPSYKAFMYKMWIDEISQLFGGLDICAVEAIVAQDGREYIFEVKDCAFQLLGETQEEDRRLIVELVLQRMNHILGVKQAMAQRESMGTAAPQNFIRHESPYGSPAVAQQRRSSGGQSQAQPPHSTSHPNTPSQHQGRPSMPPPSGPPPSQPVPPPVQPRPGQGAPSGGSRAPLTHQNSKGQPPPPRPPPARQPSLPGQSSKDGNPVTSLPGDQPVDDTMGNLRKTFKGIFGDI